MKKILGVGSIQRKEERKRRKDKEILNFKNGESTHCIKEIRNEDGIIVGYVECKDKGTVRVPIKDLEAPLFFGYGNEEYVANGMQEDMIKADKVSHEIHEEIEKAIEEAKYRMAPRISNGKVISIEICENKGE